MQDLEYALEYIAAASSIDVRVHDAALPEMYLLGSYPECEGANLHTIMSQNTVTQHLDTNVSIAVK